MSKKIRLILLGLFFLCNLGLFAVGPPGPPSGGGPPGGCWPPSSCIPIDGGLSFLLIAGAAYGGKKIYDMSKIEKAE
jgi:hypothetical protein